MFSKQTRFLFTVDHSHLVVDQDWANLFNRRVIGKKLQTPASHKIIL